MAGRDLFFNNLMTDQMSDPSTLLSQISSKGLPPVHKWNPELCGDIDIRIARDGTWFYMGSPIGRQRLVKLFSTVLRKDDDGEIYLVTPVERLRIEVDDAPFVVVEMEERGKGRDQKILFRTKTNDVVKLNEHHPLWIEFSDSGEPSPYVEIRSGLNALIARNVYYQLIELGTEWEANGTTRFGVWSFGEFFTLGRYE